MAYNSQIPQSNDQLDQSQTEMLANFMSLQAFISVDHVPFTTTAAPQANQGKHNQLTLPQPAPFSLPLANEVIIKSVLSTYTAQVEVAYQQIVAGVVTANQMTRKQNPIPIGPGWATLGGSGLLMKWGRITSNGFTIVGFPDDNGASIPRFNNPPYSITLSPISNPDQNDDIWIRMGSVTSNLLFTCYASARTTVGANPNVSFFYLAIGN